MRCPSVAVLMGRLRLTKEQAGHIRMLAKLVDGVATGVEVSTGPVQTLQEYIRRHCPKTHRYGRQCFSEPYNSKGWRRTMMLEAMNEVCGTTHGIEPLPPRGTTQYEYLNAGDSYAATIVHSKKTDSLSLRCIGDIIEQHPVW